MTLSTRILQFRGKAAALARRFPVAVCWQSLTLLIGVSIILLRPYDNISYEAAWRNELFGDLLRLVPALYGAWHASVVCRLFTEAFPVKRDKLIRIIPSILLFIALACMWYGVTSPDRHLFAETLGIYIALSFLTLFLLERINGASGLSALLFSVAFSLGTGILLFLALALCAAAFWGLVVTDADTWITDTSYLLAVLVSFGAWTPSAMLSAFPTTDARYALSAVTEKILLYLFFPVYVLLLLVLYLYVGKIILSGEMPVGKMNWYASFALFGFVFFFGTLSTQERFPLFSRFLRWGLVLFLPILIVQLYGVYLRHIAHGLTVLRCLSMICTCCGIYALVVAFLRRKPPQIYLCAAILALLFSLTPLNVADMSLRSQEARLVRLLEEHRLLEDGRVAAHAGEVPPDVSEELMDIAYYIGEDGSSLAKDVLAVRFNIPNKTYHFHAEEIKEFAVSDYQWLVRFDSGSIQKDGFLILRRGDGTVEQIDLRPYAATLLQYGKEGKYTLPMTYEAGPYRIYFYGAGIGHFSDGSVRWTYASGFVLIR